MSIGLLGRKIGMTRIIGDASVPVTVVEVVPNRVSDIKEIAKAQL